MITVRNLLTPKILLVVLSLLVVVVSLLVVYFLKSPESFKIVGSPQTPTPTLSPSPEPVFEVNGIVEKVLGSTLTIKNSTAKSIQVTLDKKVKIYQYQKGTTDSPTKQISTSGDFTKIKTGDQIFVLTNLDLTKTSTVVSENVIVVHWYLGAGK